MTYCSEIYGITVTFNVVDVADVIHIKLHMLNTY